MYVLDDGRKHCAVERFVGASPDGCTYVPVRQIGMAPYEALVDNLSSPEDVFTKAHEICLVESFGRVYGVPLDYLPPNPPIAFVISDSDQ